MADDPRVQQLLDELLDSDASPEEVCESCPELLPVVRHRWRQMHRLQADLDALFPAPDDLSPWPLQEDASRASRATRSRRSSAAAAWASSSRRGTSGSTAPSPSRWCSPARYAGPRERERFQREAEAVAGLQHPNIVQVYDVGEAGRPAVLHDGVRRGGQPGPEAGRHAPAGPPGGRRWSARWPTPCMRPHRGGIVHRDLKPANVLLDRRRHAQDHRLRPGPAARRRGGPDPDRRARGDAELHGPRAGARAGGCASGRPRTSTPWGRSSTSC